MKVTNKVFSNLFLASENERAENFGIDFTISSFLALIVIYFTYSDVKIAFLTYFVVRFIYYFSFEIIFSRTPGKFETLTLVVNSEGNKPSIFQLLTRNIIRFISIFSGVSDNERAIHDSISNTFVIKDNTLRKIEFKKIAYLIYNVSLFIYLLSIVVEYFSKEYQIDSKSTIDISIIITVIACISILYKWIKNNF
ncbi:RDD family protein [Mesoflavibacter sp. SCSIO 43206]|uniref:RDD family protein n=1 Tax=Mesoflavibacter sp. SCSIO 43206 TaxID=2779362 RepID=UPI001CA90EA8|nr:RDD family protein [Mesoflavibacter sp. SCSIO 43206]UAB74505.1 RDD family protein [Mesoflavibacter sp. SCSIO 43206]